MIKGSKGIIALNTKFDLVSQGENYAAIHTRKRQINTTSSNLLRQIRGLQAVFTEALA